MRRKAIIAAILAAGLAANLPASAADLVALVEDVSGAAAGITAFDYLATGKVIELGSTGRLIVDYLRSCARETITGGTVTIGIAHSSVTGGALKSEQAQCHGERFRLTAEQAARAGVIVLRKAPAKEDAADPQNIGQTIFSTSPLIDVSGALALKRNGKTQLIVERLDVSGERMALDIVPAALVHGAFYDFATAGRSLVPDGVYRLTIGKASVILKVDPSAAAGRSPLLGRLVRF
ncbi:MAG: hypothetical protein ACHQF3_16080 [Alphaproteobacteria bacterium]